LNDEEKTMRNIKISRVTRAATVAVLIMVGFHLAAARQTPQASGHKVNLNDLTKDILINASDQDEVLTLEWLPIEFWEVILGRSSMLTPEFAQEFIAAFGSYNIIVVVSGKVGAFGGITYKAEDDMRSSISVVDSDGQAYLPIDVSEISVDLKNFLDTLKPIMANMLGPMGKNMNPFLFPGKNSQGERLFDPRKDGRLTVRMGEREFKWRLPLGSLLPAKVCPKCGETFSGAYRFCPWDGSALVEKKDQRPAL
jgi:hypothetical protein